jgi:anaerobic selenocysteine-containing dehydrogenase
MRMTEQPIENENDDGLLLGPMKRRKFVKIAGAFGAGAALITKMHFSNVEAAGLGSEPDPVEADSITRSFCLMCHADCGLQAKIKDGVVVKIDGNPYHPATRDYSTGTEDIATETNVDFDPDKDVGTLCPKGQAGLMTMYDPYRVMYPLKRDGPRGSGRWKKISWKQALNEIINGGNLFGEGNVEGLADIRGDPENDMMDASEVYDPEERDPAKTVGEYYGPKANQMLFFYGRNMQKDFTKMWAYYAYGTANHHGHTSICEATQKVAHETTFRNSSWDYSKSGLDKGFKIKGKDHFKPDIKGCDNLVVIGAAYLEANFPMQALARYVTDSLEDGNKVWVVNPRCTKLAGKKGVNWTPIKPGGDAAMGMGLLKYIIDNNKYDTEFLGRCNDTISGGEAWTDACFIVRADTGKYVLDTDVGISTNDVPVVWDGSAFVAYDAATSAPNLEHSGQFDFGDGNVDVNSVFTLLKAETDSHTMASLNAEAGLAGAEYSDVNIQKIGEFLTESGKRTALDFYKGPSQQTSGYSACRSYVLVNVLLGNIDKKGGMNAGGGHYGYSAPGHGSAHDMHGGLKLDRQGKFYHGTTPMPARQYFPFASHGVCQEIWPSVLMGYPYKTKAVIQYYQDFAYTYPYNQIVREAMLAKEGSGYKVPLIVSFDAFMGESSALGDYILPDTCYLERWTVYHSHPTVKTKVTAIRQPVLQDNIVDVTIAGHSTKVYVGPTSSLNGTSFATVDAFLDAFDGPMVLETAICALSIKMGLPAFGDNAMGDGKHLYTAWDYNNEYAMSGDLGEGLDPATKDYMKLAGQFENPAGVYDPANADLMRNRYKKVCTLYVEQMAGEVNALNPADEYSPIPKVEGLKDSAGNDFNDDGYDFYLISHKAIQHTQSRTGQNPWLMALEPENWAEINSKDAMEIGVRTGDWVLITSASNLSGMRIKVKVSEHIRPKTVDIPWGWGHWEFGATPYHVDGESSGSNSLLGRGWNLNSLMRADPFYYENGKPASSGTDRIGGSCNQYVNQVRVMRG